MSAWTEAIAGAQATNRGGPNFIGLDGLHVVDIAAIKIVESQAAGGGTFFIVETTVVETTHTVVNVGEARSWMCNLGKKPGQADALVFVLQILGALLRRVVEQVELQDPNILHWLVAENQPARGIRFKLHTWAKQQKADKTKMFTIHDWDVLTAGETLGLEVNPNSVTHAAAAGPAPAAIAPAPAPMAPPAPAMPVGLAPPPPAAAPPGFPPAAPGYPAAAVAPPAPAYPPAAPVAPPGFPPAAPAYPGAAMAAPSQPPPGWPPGMPWPGQVVV